MTIDMSELIEEMVTSDTSAKTVIASVIYKYQRLGFELEEKPKRSPPKMPSAGVSNLTDEEVTDLQAEFVTWMDYAGEQASLQDTIYRDALSEQDLSTRKVRLKSTGTVSEREDKARTHPKVRKLKRIADASRALNSLLQNKFNSFDKWRGVCSRDVEFRRPITEGYRRDSSIRGKKRRRGPHRQSSLEPGGKRDH